MLRIWSRVGTGERIPGNDTREERVVYSIEWDALREFRESKHPDWYAPDTEPWEIPGVMRRIVAWLNEGPSFFLSPDEPEATAMDDAEAGEWLV